LNKLNKLNKINKFHLTIGLFLTVIIFSTLLIYTNVLFARNIPNTGKPVYEDKHQSCSNDNRKECVANCPEEGRDIEREPKQSPTPVPTPTTTPQPPFAGQTTTTTTSSMPLEVRCMSTNDCKIGFVCCQNVCREQSKGICRDINGDGIPDWLVYIV
jgi:hypothetical protein